MLALLDSGVGGLTVARALRALCPSVDILYLADSANAPYGTKSERELLPLLVRSIEALLARGGARVVLACITASCLYDRLPEALKPHVIPILPFVAEEIAASGGRVGIIATEATVHSAALPRALLRYGCHAPVERCAAQRLVALAEAGRTDASDPEVREALERAIAPLLYRGVDTLVLGCTHFPYFEEAIRSLYGGLRIISPARVGSEALVRTLPPELLLGEGRFLYLVSSVGGRERLKMKDRKK